MFGLFVALSITTYPAFGDRVSPSHLVHPRVEAEIDKGPIVELIVNCRPGTTIITYSKAEQLFCTPKRGCMRAIAAAVTQSCNP
jgi:hypothetical protein